MKKYLCFLSAFLLFGNVNLMAQDSEQGKFHSHHSIGFVVSHTQITEGLKDNGHKKWLSLPSWGLNYNFHFSSKWAIGLHSDIIVEDFLVHDEEEGEVIERSYPIASAIIVSFKPGKHFSFMLGPGEEFAHTGNLFLIRAGIEYGLHIHKGWELNALITNDYKVNAYNSWAIGLGITKIF